jgi:hypothetical protein
MNKICGITLRGRGDCPEPVVYHVDVPVSDPIDLAVFPSGFVRVYLCAKHYDHGKMILELHSLPQGVYFHD